MRKLITSILLFSFGSINGQWVQLNQDTIYVYTSIFFLNPDTGFVCGVDDYNGDGIVIRTLDGGNTWDTTKLIGNAWMMDIQFLNDSVGFTGGHDGGINITNDMGNSWSANGSCSTPYDFSNFFFFDQDTALVHGFSGDIRRYTPNSLPICTNLYFSSSSNFFPGTGELFFLNENLGYLAGGNGIFAKTNNKGITWNHFNCDSSVYILNAVMTDTGHVVLVGKQGMTTVSNDGGLNWSVPMSISGYDIMSVDFYNSQFGYCVGGFNQISSNILKGLIWKTIDGGLSWTVDDSSFNEQLIDIHIVNDSLAFAVGFDGQVYRNKSHYTILSLNNSSVNSVVNIYPNPFSEQLFINAKDVSGLKLIFCVYDVNGTLIREPEKINISDEMEISTAGWSEGLYFAKIIFDNYVLVKKIVKVK